MTEMIESGDGAAAQGSAEVPEGATTRKCGYSRCENQVVNERTGRGRPRVYCTVDGGKPRRWPDMGGRTCKQLALGEKVKLADAGVGEISAMFDDFADDDDPAVDLLADLVAALNKRNSLREQVLVTAAEQVTAAQAEKAAALEAAKNADTERERAVGQAALSEKARQEALEAKALAERRAAAAERERDEKVRAAEKTRGEAVSAKHKAEAETAGAKATAVAARAALEEARELSGKIAKRNEVLDAELRALTKENTALTGTAASATARAEGAEARATTAEQLAATATTRADQADRDLGDARGEVTELRAAIATATTRAEDATRTLGEERQRAAADLDAVRTEARQLSGRLEEFRTAAEQDRTEAARDLAEARNALTAATGRAELLAEQLATAQRELERARRNAPGRETPEDPR